MFDSRQWQHHLEQAHLLPFSETQKKTTIFSQESLWVLDCSFPSAGSVWAPTKTGRNQAKLDKTELRRVSPAVARCRLDSFGVAWFRSVSLAFSPAFARIRLLSVAFVRIRRTPAFGHFRRFQTLSLGFAQCRRVSPGFAWFRSFRSASHQLHMVSPGVVWFCFVTFGVARFRSVFFFCENMVVCCACDQKTTQQDGEAQLHAVPSTNQQETDEKTGSERARKATTCSTTFLNTLLRHKKKHLH